MGLIEFITAVGAIGGVVYILLAQMLKKDPHKFDRMKKWMSSTPKPPEDLKERMEQIYPEKRMGL